MQGASREAYARAEDALSELLDREASAEARVDLARSLFELTGLLDRELALRRTLADPTVAADAKRQLLRALFVRSLGADTVGLLESVAADRWSRPRDLTDTLERLAAMSAFAGAEQAGTLDDVEDELFRFGRALEREPALRAALSDPNLPTERKRAVVEALLVGRAQAVTVMIVDRIVQAPRGRTLESALAEYSELAARRRDRTLATVTTAVPLTDVQHRRLAAALTRIYGRRVVLQADLDPDVVGGVRVRIGDEIIDGTVVTRLALAARRIAGAP